MAKAYYSTIIAQPADAVWQVIRDFNNYPVWVDGAGESAIEDDRAGDAVGCVRDVLYKGARRRQRLLALSDVERAQTYAFEGEIPLPVENFEATIRVTPVTDGDIAFVEWWATFDCAAEDRVARVTFLQTSFAGWLESLRRHLLRRVA
ncbi:MAG: SRPBCC family protein [Pseudolabrys sp.]